MTVRHSDCLWFDDPASPTPHTIREHKENADVRLILRFLNTKNRFPSWAAVLCVCGSQYIGVTCIFGMV